MIDLVLLSVMAEHGNEADEFRELHIATLKELGKVLLELGVGDVGACVKAGGLRVVGLYGGQVVCGSFLGLPEVFL